MYRFLGGLKKRSKRADECYGLLTVVSGRFRSKGLTTKNKTLALKKSDNLKSFFF